MCHIIQDYVRKTTLSITLSLTESIKNAAYHQQLYMDLLKNHKNLIM